MSDLTVSDGTRHLGRIIERAGGFEAYDADNDYIAKYETIAQARAAIIRADREREAELDRMVDDGAPAD